jgi:hypothetical protein
MATGKMVRPGNFDACQTDTIFTGNFVRTTAVDRAFEKRKAANDGKR